MYGTHLSNDYAARTDVVLGCANLGEIITPALSLKHKVIAAIAEASTKTTFDANHCIRRHLNRSTLGGALSLASHQLKRGVEFCRLAND
jgi:hypothetical protein